MPTTASEGALFLSSFAPLFVVFGLLHSFGTGWPTYICYGLAVLATVTLFVMLRVWRRMASSKVRVARARHRDADAIGYVATYVVPFAAMGVSTWESKIALLFFMLLVGVLYLRAHLFYVNPLLSVIGYRLFEIETERGRVLLVITKRKFMQLNLEIDVRTLSDYIFLEADVADSSRR